jgi:hypothetical protein
MNPHEIMLNAYLLNELVQAGSSLKTAIVRKGRAQRVPAEKTSKSRLDE